MNKPIGIILAIVMIIMLFIRMARCSNATGKYLATRPDANFYELCQETTDSAVFYIKPATDALAAKRMISADTLLNITLKLDDLSTKVKAYDAPKKEESQKETVVEFIEMCRALTCCYMPKYQDEIKKQKFTKGNLSNLKRWIEQSGNWGYSNTANMGVTTYTSSALSVDFTSALEQIMNYEKTIK